MRLGHGDGLHSSDELQNIPFLVRRQIITSCRRTLAHFTATDLKIAWIDDFKDLLHFEKVK